MTVREIQGFLAEQYGTEVSPEFISAVTDAVMAEVAAWQAGRSSRCTGDLLRRAAGQDPRGCGGAQQGDLPGFGRAARRHARDPGLWIESTEGAKFWLKVFNDLKTRGVADILIAVTDGLKGIGEALGRCSRPPRCRPASCT